MNVYLHVALAVCLVVAAAGCDQLPFMPSRKSAAKSSSSSAALPVRGTIIAKVNAIPITLEDMNQEIEAYNSLVPPEQSDVKITTREQKISYVKDQMVRAALLYQDALDRRLDDNEEVQRILDRTRRELMVVQLLRKESDAMDVTSQEVETFYNTYKERFKKPEERQIREIVVASEAEAKDVLIQLLQGADFSTVARERSTAESKKDGGNLGFVRPGVKSQQFDAAAFADSFEQGSVSSIIKTPDGFSLLKFEGRRGGEAVALSEVFEDIKRTLTVLKQREKIDEIVNRIKENAKVEIYESEIK